MMAFLCLILPALLSLSPYQAKTVCRYEPEIIKHSRAHNLEPELVAAMIFVESSFHRNVVSTANACGLMQVIPKWTGFRETAGVKYTCAQLKNPRTAIKVGTQILSYMIRRYAKGNLKQGLCYYNAGNRCITQKNYYKKISYVKKVERVRDKIKIAKRKLGR